MEKNKIKILNIPKYFSFFLSNFFLWKKYLKDLSIAKNNIICLEAAKVLL